MKCKKENPKGEEMTDKLVAKILDRTPNACKAWSIAEKKDDGIHLHPVDDGPVVVVNELLIEDGLEAFAEVSLRHVDAKFRDTARKSQREQYKAITLRNDNVSPSLQYADFGEQLISCDQANST